MAPPAAAASAMPGAARGAARDAGRGGGRSSGAPQRRAGPGARPRAPVLRRCLAVLGLVCIRGAGPRTFAAPPAPAPLAVPAPAPPAGPPELRRSGPPVPHRRLARLAPAAPVRRSFARSAEGGGQGGSQGGGGQGGSQGGGAPPAWGLADDGAAGAGAAAAAAAAAERRDLVAEIREAAAALDRGFAAGAGDREAMTSKLQALAKLNPSREPAREIGGRWTLLYTDAPDILGIPATGGPLVELARIGQEIDAGQGTIANVIEWKAPRWLTGLASAISEDTIVQRVFTDFVVASPSKVDLKIKGLGLQPRRALGVDLPAAARFELRGPLALPFGAFEVLYSDGALRVVRTTSGYYSVNQREGDFP